MGYLIENFGCEWLWNFVSSKYVCLLLTEVKTEELLDYYRTILDSFVLEKYIFTNIYQKYLYREGIEMGSFER